MGQVVSAIGAVFRFLKNNKLKIGMIPVFAVCWTVLLFPYSDVRSFVSTTLSRTIGEGVAIDFERINLSWGFPVALELNGFEFEAPGVPPIAADRLVARPSLGAMIRKTVEGSIDADGMYSGQIRASISEGAILKSGQAKQEINAEISGLQLADLTKSLRRAGFLSFVAQGTFETTAKASVDPLFEEQPEADLKIQAKSISIPSVAIPIPNMGPVQTPSLQLGKLDLKGRLSDGKIIVEELSFGQPKDSLAGRVRGEFGLLLQKDAQGARAVPGAYDLKIELSVSKSMMDAMAKSGVGIALLLVDKFKVETPDAMKYSFRMRAPGVGITPNFEALGAN